MRKNRFFAFLLLLCSMLLLLSSCYQLRESYKIKIRNDGGVIMHDIVISKSTYDLMIEYGMDASEIKEIGAKITFYEEDDVEYAKISKKEVFNSLEELNGGLKAMGGIELEKSEVKISDTFFSQIIATFDEQSDTISVCGVVKEQEYPGMYISCKVVFQFSGMVQENDIGTKIDKKSIEIDMLEVWENTPGKEFSITAKAGSLKIAKAGSSKIVLLWGSLCIIGAVLIIGASVMLIVIKRKERKARIVEGDKMEIMVSEKKTWDCACGMRGIASKFCPECGAKSPDDFEA